MRRWLASAIGFLALLPFASSVYAASPPLGGPPVTPGPPPRTQPATFPVDCSAGQTIQGTLSTHAFISGDTLLVSGTCNEAVLIPETVNAITLDGQGIATLNGVDPTTSNVTVHGRGITIQGFTITGGPAFNVGPQVMVERGGSATIQNNRMLNPLDTGITVQRNATAKILGNTVENYADCGIDVKEESSARIFSNTLLGTPNSNGIRVRENSSARIGLNSTSDAAPSPNLIQNNFIGVQVRANSSAIIGGNTISNNLSHGIVAVRNSHIDAVDNVLQGNTGNGIFINEESSLELSSINDSWGSQPNSTGTPPNGGYGIACRFGGYVLGPQGPTLTGTLGRRSLDSSCLNGFSD